MKIEYTLTPNDVTRFNNYMQSRNSSGSSRILRILIPLVVLLAVVYISTSNRPRGAFHHSAPINTHALTIAIAVPLGVLVLFGILALAMRRMNARSFDIMRVELTPTHVNINTRGMDTDIRWPRIQSIEQDEYNIYLLQGPDLATVIPKSAFSDVDTAERFFETATAFRNEVGAQPSASPGPAPDARGVVVHAVSKQDAEHAHWFWLRNFARRRLVLTVATIAVVTAVLMTIMWGPVLFSHHGYSSAMIAGTLPVFVLPVFMWMIFLSPSGTVANFVGSDPSRLSTVALRESGIDVSAPVFERLVSWADVNEVRRDGRLVYILSPRDLIWVIPLSAFANGEEADRFVATANALRRGDSLAQDDYASEAYWPPAPSA